MEQDKELEWGDEEIQGLMNTLISLVAAMNQQHEVMGVLLSSIDVLDARTQMLTNCVEVLDARTQVLTSTFQGLTDRLSKLEKGE